MKFFVQSAVVFCSFCILAPSSSAYLASDFPILTPSNRRAIIAEQKQVFTIYNSGTTVFKKRQQATTGFTGRFYLIKPALQSANLSGARRQALSQKRGGAYRNVTREIGAMGDARLSSKSTTTTVKMNRRSVQAQKLQN